MSKASEYKYLKKEFEFRNQAGQIFCSVDNNGDLYVHLGSCRQKEVPKLIEWLQDIFLDEETK